MVKVTEQDGNIVIEGGWEVGVIDGDNLDSLITQLCALDDAGRERLFTHLESLWCRHCGSEQPTKGRSCQCWNDE